MGDERREVRPSVDGALVAAQTAFERGAWSEARAAFAEALAHGESPEALEGLSRAAWWLEDVAGCLDARERAYHAYRGEQDQRGAARMALWLGDDHLSFRGAQAVADGWFRRAARLLDELPTCPARLGGGVRGAHRPGQRRSRRSWAASTRTWLLRRGRAACCCRPASRCATTSAVPNGARRWPHSAAAWTPDSSVGSAVRTTARSRDGMAGGRKPNASC